MGRRLIEVMQVLVDQIHQGGYQHRVLEDDIYAESQKRIAAEKDRDHWKQARQDAIAAGELMQAEIETLREKLDAAQAAVTLQRAGIERLQAFVSMVRAARDEHNGLARDAIVEAALAELDADTEPAPVAEPIDAEGGACPGN